MLTDIRMSLAANELKKPAMSTEAGGRLGRLSIRGGIPSRVHRQDEDDAGTNGAARRANASNFARGAQP